MSDDTCTGSLKRRDVKRLVRRLRNLGAKLDEALDDAKICPVCRVKLLSDMVIFAAHRDKVHPKTTMAAFLSGVRLYYPGAQVEMLAVVPPAADKVH